MRKTPDLFHSMKQKRILEVDRLLRTPGGMTRHEICRRLETMGFPTSRQTFVRDINALRHEYGAQHNVGHEDRLSAATGKWETHWFYRDPTWTLGRIQLTEGALFSLLVARRVVEQYAGTPVADALQQAYSRLEESMNRKITIHHDVLACISFSTDRVAEVDSTVWGPLLKAVVAHRELQIEYVRKWGSKSQKVDQKVVRPYHIVNLCGSWYLLAPPPGGKAGAIRQYAVSGIRSAKLMKRTFAVPASFDIEELMDITFGRFIGDPDDVVDVRLRFAASVAPLLRDRKRGPREVHAELPDGRIEVSFPASRSGPWPLYHVKSWVLSWGTDVEVLEPAELKNLVCSDVEALAERFHGAA